MENQQDIDALPEWARQRIIDAQAHVDMVREKLVELERLVSPPPPAREAVSRIPPATANQQKFLRALLRHPDRYKSYDYLIETIWGDDPNGGPENPSNGLRVMAFNLRKRLEPYGIPEDFIETSWGLGYRIKSECVDDLREVLDQHVPVQINDPAQIEAAV